MTNSKQVLTKKTTNRLKTVNRRFISGLILGIFIVISPYLFYLYRVPAEELQVLETKFFTIHASGFYDVGSYLHALFTKIALVFFTSLAFLKINDWWKWSLLVPLIMFLYQLFAVMNSNWQFFDEYSFLHSLIPIIPIVAILIYSTLKLNNKIDKLNLHDRVQAEYESTLKNEGL